MKVIPLWRNRITLLFGAMALAGILAFAACGGDDDDAPAPAQQPAAAPAEEAAPAEAAAPAEEAAPAEAAAPAEEAAPAEAAAPAEEAAMDDEAMMDDEGPADPTFGGRKMPLPAPGQSRFIPSGGIESVPVPVLYDSSDEYPAATGEVVKIGLVHPLSGTLKQVGDAHRHGATAALRVLGPVNVGGTYHPLEIVPKEAAANDWDPQLAAVACQELANNDQVHVITGLGGGEGEGCNSVADRIQIPIVGVNTVTMPLISDKCTYWTINVGTSPAQSGNAFPDAVTVQIGEELAGEPFWAVTDAPDWGRQTAEVWADLTGTEIDTLDIAPGGTTDWAPFIEKMLESGLKGGIVTISWGTQYTSFIQQAGESGLSKQMVLSSPIGVPEYIANTPGVAEHLPDWRNLTQYVGIWGYEDLWDTSRSAGVNILNKLNTAGYNGDGQYSDPWGTEVIPADDQRAPSGQGQAQAAGVFMIWQAIDRADSLEPGAIMAELLGTESEPAWFWTPDDDRPVRVDTPGRQVSLPVYVANMQENPGQRYGDQYAFFVDSNIPPEINMTPPIPELANTAGYDGPSAGSSLGCNAGFARQAPNGMGNQTSRIN